MAIAFDKDLGGSNNNSSGTAPLTLSTANAAASGSFIVVCMTWYNATALTGTISGGSLTWTTEQATKSTSGSDNGVNAAIAWAQAPSGLAASTTLTLNVSGAGSLGGNSLSAFSFTGVAASSPVDVKNANSNATSPNWTAGNLVTTNANDVVVGYGAADSTGTASPGGTPATPTTGWTEVHDISDATAGEQYESIYQIFSSTSTYVAGGVWSTGPGTLANVGVSVAFKAAATLVDPHTFSAIPFQAQGRNL